MIDWQDGVEPVIEDVGPGNAVGHCWCLRHGQGQIHVSPADPLTRHRIRLQAEVDMHFRVLVGETADTPENLERLGTDVRRMFLDNFTLDTVNADTRNSA